MRPGRRGWRTVQQAVLAHQCAHHLVDVHGVRWEIFRAHREAGQHDRAIAAMREAIAEGYRSTPDPETEIAEVLVESGRLDEGAALFENIRDRDPDDVWLYNAAALTYEAVAPATALRWALAGIEVAIRTGDPDQVVVQLLETAERAWTASGQDPDRSVQERVEAFVTGWRRPAVRVTTGGALDPLPADRLCDHCGFTAELLRPPPPRAKAGQPGGVIGMSWFAPGEWAAATARWPDLLDGRAADQLGYNHEVEGSLKRYAQENPGSAPPGRPADRRRPRRVRGRARHRRRQPFRPRTPGGGDHRPRSGHRVAAGAERAVLVRVG
jgi:tetratricopeptide (TPR) repeat protein